MKSFTDRLSLTAIPTLRDMLVDQSYFRKQPGEEPFILRSGKQSIDYLEASRTTRNPYSQLQIAMAILRNVPQGVKAVGGPTMGADPIAAAVSMWSVHTGSPMTWFSIRQEKKDHGNAEWIEGYVPKNSDVVVVDDVVTTGGSLLEAVEHCQEAGLNVVSVITLVDRMSIEDRLDFTSKLHKTAGPMVNFWAPLTFTEIQYAWEKKNRT